MKTFVYGVIGYVIMIGSYIYHTISRIVAGFKIT